MTLVIEPAQCKSECNYETKCNWGKARPEIKVHSTCLKISFYSQFSSWTMQNYIYFTFKKCLCHNFMTIKSDTNHIALLHCAICSWTQSCLGVSLVQAKLLCEINLQSEGLVKRLYTKYILKGQVSYGN